MATPADIGIGIGEAAKRTGLSQWQLRKMARDEAIRCRRTGRFLRFHPADVVALEARLWTGRAIESNGAETVSTDANTACGSARTRVQLPAAPPSCDAGASPAFADSRERPSATFAPGRGAPPQGSHARLSSLPFAPAGAPSPSTDEVSA